MKADKIINLPDTVNYPASLEEVFGYSSHFWKDVSRVCFIKSVLSEDVFETLWSGDRSLDSAWRECAKRIREEAKPLKVKRLKRGQKLSSLSGDIVRVLESPIRLDVYPLVGLADGSRQWIRADLLKPMKEAVA